MTAANSIVSGYGNGKFGPSDNITRQDLVVILAHYMDFADIEMLTTREHQMFNDHTDISDYAKEAAEQCYRTGIINGKPGNIFDPKGQATRAEAAAMLHRFFEQATAK